MKKFLGILVLGLLWCNSSFALPKCEGDDPKKWTNCEGSFDYKINKYSGEYKDGKRHGKGTSILPDGSKLVGEFKDDQPHGHGTMTLPNGVKYIGQWKDGIPNGQGTLTIPDGEKYVGEWKDGLLIIKIKNGIVTTVSAEHGAIYNGEMIDGVGAHGHGTMTYVDGSKYIGEWKNDRRHGKGTITFPDGVKYIGEYKDGKRHGQGTLTFKSFKYVGEWKDGQANGQGTEILPDGKKYVGEWKDGKKHGQGTHTSEDGTVTKGIWKKGKFVKELK